MMGYYTTAYIFEGPSVPELFTLFCKAAGIGDEHTETITISKRAAITLRISLLPGPGIVLKYRKGGLTAPSQAEDGAPDESYAAEIIIGTNTSEATAGAHEKITMAAALLLAEHGARWAVRHEDGPLCQIAPGDSAEQIGDVLRKVFYPSHPFIAIDELLAGALGQPAIGQKPSEEPSVMQINSPAGNPKGSTAKASISTGGAALLRSIQEKRMLRALQEIYYLHTDSAAGPCPVCVRPKDGPDDDGFESWPCPTVRAIHDIGLRNKGNGLEWTS